MTWRSHASSDSVTACVRRIEIITHFSSSLLTLFSETHALCCFHLFSEGEEPTRSAFWFLEFSFVLRLIKPSSNNTREDESEQKGTIKPFSFPRCCAENTHRHQNNAENSGQRLRLGFWLVQYTPAAPQRLVHESPTFFVGVVRASLPFPSFFFSLSVHCCCCFCVFLLAGCLFKTYFG